MAGLFPCSAPIAAVVGLFWWPSHRAAVAKLPALNRALCIIGLGIALLQTGLIILFALLHALSAS